MVFVIECKIFTEKSIDLFARAIYYSYLCNIQAAIMTFAAVACGAGVVLYVNKNIV